MAVLLCEIDAARTAWRSEHGVSLNEQVALSLIAAQGAVTAGAIAEHVGIAPPSVTLLLERLDAAGWIHRVRDEDDGRKVLVTASKRLTVEIRALLRVLDETMDAAATGEGAG